MLHRSLGTIGFRDVTEINLGVNEPFPPYGIVNLFFVLPSFCTASPVSGHLLHRSLGTIGFRDVTETAHTEKEA